MSNLNKIEIEIRGERCCLLVEGDFREIIQHILDGKFILDGDGAVYFNPKHISMIRASKTTPPPY